MRREMPGTPRSNSRNRRTPFRQLRHHQHRPPIAEPVEHVADTAVVIAKGVTAIGGHDIAEAFTKALGRTVETSGHSSA
jgi:hypothetical protein